MEPKTTGSATAAGLGLADKQIDAIIESHLPSSPHLLSVPTTQHYLPEFPYENKNTCASKLFENWEVRRLQYMTLVSHGDRGVALAQGNWEEEINALSPQSLGLTSSANTPNPRKEPKVKLSMSDYKKVKKGEMVMPKPSTSPKPENKGDTKAKTLPGSTVTKDTTNTRRAPIDDRKNGALPVSGKKTDHRLPGRDANGISSLPPKPPRPDTKPDRPSPRTNNSNLERPKHEQARSKDNTPVRTKPDHEQKFRDPKPPISSRPSASSNIWDTKKKRPLELSSVDLPSEKRTRIENTNVRNNFHNNTSSRLDSPGQDNKTSLSKPGHSRSTSNLSHVSPLQPPQPKKPNSKPSDATSHPSKSKAPNHLPPLLSPLPADLGISLTDSGFGELKPEKRPGKSPGKPSGDRSKQDSPPSSRSSSPEKYTLEPLLPPLLPDVVEQELAKLQQKAAQSTFPTVEARHEKARLPDAPGVARKTVKPKVGHPPKKERAASTNSKSTDEKPSLIIKLRYGKRNRDHIKALLRFKSVPSAEFRKLEAQRIEADRRSRMPETVQEESSEDDAPLMSTKPTARKRPMESGKEPPVKRKAPENLDAGKAATPLTPAFRSPGVSGSAQKNVLLTPKKGDAMKSAIGGVAMRKIDSQDGHARTPQAASTSTPASAERPRVNGEVRPEYNDLGLRLKRKMDKILKTKEKPPVHITEKEKVLGLSVGVECICAYMLNASAISRSEQKNGRQRTPVHWEQVIALWEFLEYQCRFLPALHAIALFMGAACREELHNIYAETKNDKIWTSWNKRSGIWSQCHREKGALHNLQGNIPDFSVGPWTAIEDTTAFAYSVLGGITKKEGIEWKKEG